MASWLPYKNLVRIQRCWVMALQRWDTETYRVTQATLTHQTVTHCLLTVLAVFFAPSLLCSAISQHRRVPRRFSRSASGPSPAAPCLQGDIRMIGRLLCLSPAATGDRSRSALVVASPRCVSAFLPRIRNRPVKGFGQAKFVSGAGFTRETAYSNPATRRDAFLAECIDLLASILALARRERLRFWRRIFSSSARCAAT